MDLNIIDEDFGYSALQEPPQSPAQAGCPCAAVPPDPAVLSFQGLFQGQGQKFSPTAPKESLLASAQFSLHIQILCFRVAVLFLKNDPPLPKQKLFGVSFLDYHFPVCPIT